LLLVVADAEFAAKSDAFDFFPIKTIIGRVVVEAGEGVDAIIVPIGVGLEVETQVFFESFCLFYGEEVFQFEAVEFANGFGHVFLNILA